MSGNLQTRYYKARSNRELCMANLHSSRLPQKARPQATPGLVSSSQYQVSRFLGVYSPPMTMSLQSTSQMLQVSPEQRSVRTPTADMEQRSVRTQTADIF